MRQVAAHKAEGTPTVLMLYDLPNGAMDYLAEFLERLTELDVVFTQHFPDEVVVIREGRPLPACDRYVAARKGSLAVG